jgi:hypothetical protein
MIIGCLIFYNEEQFLSDWYESLAPHVDKIIAIDGQINGMPGDQAYSTDRSHQILGARSKVDNFATNVVWPDEQTKRSAYLVGAPGDWYVVVDADELLVNGDELYDEIDSLEGTPHDFAQIRVIGYGADRLAGRVFRHQVGLKYMHRHFWLGIGDEVLWEGRTGPILDGPYLRHRKDERPPERLKAKALLQTQQAKVEFPYDR